MNAVFDCLWLAVLNTFPSPKNFEQGWSTKLNIASFDTFCARIGPSSSGNVIPWKTQKIPCLLPNRWCSKTRCVTNRSGRSQATKKQDTSEIQMLYNIVNWVLLILLWLSCPICMYASSIFLGASQTLIYVARLISPFMYDETRKSRKKAKIWFSTSFIFTNKKQG